MSNLNEGSTNGDLWMFRGLSNRSGILEYVTPYKICVVVFISEFCLLKIKSEKRTDVRRALFKTDVNTIHTRRDMCMLLLKLIQSPDMDYKDLLKLLESGKYRLTPSLVDNFKSKCADLALKESGSVQDVLNNVESMSIEPNFEPLLNQSSKVGLFIRRVVLFYEKLSFSQTVSAFNGFQNYLNSLSIVESDSTAVTSAHIESVIDLGESGITEQPMSVDMDLSPMTSIYDDPSSIHSKRILSKNSLNDSMKEGEAADTDNAPVGLWSRRQAELFMAQQAKLLMSNPKEALHPSQLQSKLRDVITTNPEQAEAHYLSYLNCLRVNEYCGAVDSLFHYFDRKTSSYDENSVRSQGLRHASLNLAILHAHFNNRNEALSALKEAITLAHEANDNVALQYAQAWLYQLQHDDQEVLIQRSIAKSEELNLNYLSSLGLQSLAESASLSGCQPSQVFELISRSDVINTHHSQIDLLATGLAMKVALWSMYGRNDLSVLCAQQLLHLYCKNKSDTAAGGDSSILALINLVHFFAIQGEYQIGWALVGFGRKQSPDSKWWLWAENILYFIESLNKGDWQHAQSAANQLATVDPIEAQLRLCELLLVKGNRCEALKIAESITNTGYTKSKVSPIAHIRALYLSSKANPKGSLLRLCQAFQVAHHHHIEYWAGLICLEIANIQLEMGLKSQAMKLVDEALLSTLSVGVYSDMSDAILLYAECCIATATNENRAQMINDAVMILSKAVQLAKQIENYSKVKKLLHFQAVLCNEVGNIAERNKYAREFRILDEQFSMNDSPIHS